MLNAAARLIMLSRKCDHITPLLYELQWLPVDQRIAFKLLLYTFKVVNGMAPSYLCDLIEPYIPARALRSAGKLLLRQPTYRLKTYMYGSRSFSICAPRLWNSLPVDIRKTSTITEFKSKLNTFLFRQTFNEF